MDCREELLDPWKAMPSNRPGPQQMRDMIWHNYYHFPGTWTLFRNSVACTTWKTCKTSTSWRNFHSTALKIRIGQWRSSGSERFTQTARVPTREKTYLKVKTKAESKTLWWYFKLQSLYIVDGTVSIRKNKLYTSPMDLDRMYCNKSARNQSCIMLWHGRGKGQLYQ